VAARSQPREDWPFGKRTNHLAATGAGRLAGKADLLICPHATLVAALADKASGKGIAVGAQDCHPKASGAHTADISAEMLADAGAKATLTMIVLGVCGRSFRRSLSTLPRHDRVPALQSRTLHIAEAERAVTNED
jgi:hypothetical protein